MQTLFTFPGLEISVFSTEFQLPVQITVIKFNRNIFLFQNLGKHFGAKEFKGNQFKGIAMVSEVNLCKPFESHSTLVNFDRHCHFVLLMNSRPP